MHHDLSTIHGRSHRLIHSARHDAEPHMGGEGSLTVRGDASSNICLVSLTRHRSTNIASFDLFLMVLWTFIVWRDYIDPELCHTESNGVSPCFSFVGW